MNRINVIQAVVEFFTDFNPGHYYHAGLAVVKYSDANLIRDDGDNAATDTFGWKTNFVGPLAKLAHTTGVHPHSG